MQIDCFEPHFSGLPTFMRAAFVPEASALAHDVAVIGIPLDQGVCFREGAKYAPRSIREHSLWDCLKPAEYIDLVTGVTHHANELTIADTGDVTIYPGNATSTSKTIMDRVRNVRRRSFPLILGGDHSLTYAAFRGCKQGLPKSLLPVGLLHFDAHPDVEGSFDRLPDIWHGNPFRKLIDEGELDGTNMVTIGARGFVEKNCHQYIIKAGITLHTATEVRRRGLDKVMLDAISKVMQRCQSLYVTFDIDVIDPCNAPGTGTPSFGGLFPIDILPALRLLRPTRIVGFDLVEVNPHLDPSGLTCLLSTAILWEFLAFGLGKESLRVRHATAIK